MYTEANHQGMVWFSHRHAQVSKTMNDSTLKSTHVHWFLQICKKLYNTIKPGTELSTHSMPK